MSYTPTTWASGDTITSTKLNKIEQGISEASETGGGMLINMVLTEVEDSGSGGKKSTKSYSSGSGEDSGDSSNMYPAFDKTAGEIFEAIEKGCMPVIKIDYNVLYAGESGGIEGGIRTVTNNSQIMFVPLTQASAYDGIYEFLLFSDGINGIFSTDDLNGYPVLGHSNSNSSGGGSF